MSVSRSPHNPSVEQYQTIIKHLQKTNDSMAHEVCTYYTYTYVHTYVHTCVYVYRVVTVCYENAYPHTYVCGYYMKTFSLITPIHGRCCYYICTYVYVPNIQLTSVIYFVEHLPEICSACEMVYIRTYMYVQHIRTYVHIHTYMYVQHICTYVRTYTIYVHMHVHILGLDSSHLLADTPEGRPERCPQC